MQDDQRIPYNKQYGPQEALVGANDDPNGIGRVKVQFPGMDGLSDWAFPLNGGSKNRGSWFVPDLNTSVVCYFVSGDPNRGIFYISSYWARDGENNEVPTVVQEAIEEDGPEAASQIDATVSNSFALVFDRREGKERVFIRSERFNTDPNEGDSLLLELDADTGMITLNAPAGIIIRTHGRFEVEANAGIVLNKRVLQTATTGPI